MPYATILKVNFLTATPVLAYAGRVGIAAVRSINLTGATAFVQMFDAASIASVTAGVTVPDWVVKSEGGNPSIGDGLPDDGIVFSNGLVVLSTTTPTGGTDATQHVRFGII